MTRAEYYEDLTQHWHQMLVGQMFQQFSRDCIVSTARMLAHFGQTALDSREMEMLKGLIEQAFAVDQVALSSKEKGR